MREAIIDTDPGIDDALALMLAIKSKKLNIRAITTVAGNTTIANATRNARYILKLLDREDIPVYSGSKKPLKRALVKTFFHGKNGLANIRVQNSAALTGNAVQKIISITRSSPEDKITLITLGPLTNIAKAIKSRPEVMRKIREIVMFAGAINEQGNINRVSEFNVFTDPEAADIVFRFPVKKTIITIDACNRVRLHLKEFKKIINPKLKGPILKMMNFLVKQVKRQIGVAVALMYDPLAVYYLISPSACKIKKHDILVETKGEITRGMTVADLRPKTKKNKNVYVVERISENRFRRDLIGCLCKEQK